MGRRAGRPWHEGTPPGTAPARRARGTRRTASRSRGRARAAEQPTRPDEPATPQQRVPLAGEEHVPELGTKQPADHSRDHDVGRILLVQAAAAEVELDGPARHQERHHHHQTVAGELDGAEVEDEGIDGHSERGTRKWEVGTGSTTSRPGRGKSARASRVQSLRSPSPSRYQPARAIIAALSAFSRGLATATRAAPASRSAARAANVRLHATPPPST